MSGSQEGARTRAFVIGPIGDRDAPSGSAAQIAYENGLESFERIIVPACSGLDIDAFRSDHIVKGGEIPEQVFRQLRDAQIVIADLTDANPNVMYELGLRHTTGKLTVQIGEKGRLPFDISTIRTILFNRTEFGFVEAKRSLMRALMEGLESGGDPVTATRVWFEPLGVLSFEGAVSDADDSLTDDSPGFLELIADTESGITEIAQTISTSASILEEISTIVSEGAKRMNGLPASGNYSAAKLAEANRIATLLNDPAVRLNMVAQDFAKHVEKSTPGMVYMLEQIATNPEQLEQAGDFPEQIAHLVAAAGEAAENSTGFIEAFESGGEATRLLRRVNGSICRSARMIAAASRKIADWQLLLDRIPRL